MRYLITLIFLATCLLSCEKTTVEPEIPFTAGSVDGMDLNDTRLNLRVNSPYGGHEYAYIDIDGDSADDIQLTAYYSVSYGSKSSSLASINDDLTFASTVELDSIFLCEEISGTNTSRTYFNPEANFTCGNTPVFSSTNDYEYLTPVEAGAEIPRNVYWSGASQRLAYLNTSGSSYMEGGQTVYSGNFIQKVGWSNGAYHYMLFKLDNGYQVRNGWLKLRVGNYYEVTVDGWAIQSVREEI